MKLADAFKRLTDEFKRDSDYARTWHDNIAVAYQDCGVDWETSNKGASTLMRRFFGVETGSHNAPKITPHK